MQLDLHNAHEECCAYGRSTVPLRGTGRRSAGTGQPGAVSSTAVQASTDSKARSRRFVSRCPATALCFCHTRSIPNGRYASLVAYYLVCHRYFCTDSLDVFPQRGRISSKVE